MDYGVEGEGVLDGKVTNTNLIHQSKIAIFSRWDRNLVQESLV